MHIFHSELLTNTKKLLLVIFCDMTAGIGSVTGKTGWDETDSTIRTERREKVEIIM